MTRSHLTIYGSCPTQYSVGFRTIRDAIGREKRGAAILENGRPYQTIVYETREEAAKQARAVAQIRTAVYAETGANGWPMVAVGPNDRFPGEMKLVCPQCGASDITMSVQYPAYGTGSRGQGRLGDPGSRDTIKCNSCGCFKAGE